MMTVGGESLVNEVMRMKSHDGISAFIRDPRDFLVVQGLRIHLPMQGVSLDLVGELRSHMPMRQPSLSATIRKRHHDY